MNENSQSGWSLPLSTILIALVVLAVVIWGFSALLYVAGLVAVVTVLVMVSDKVRHSRRCPECQLAKKLVESEHGDWEVRLGWRSHRATEEDRSVIAVFYRAPGVRTRPDPYKLVSVSHDNDSVQEMALEEESQYRVRNYK